MIVYCRIRGRIVGRGSKVIPLLSCFGSKDNKGLRRLPLIDIAWLSSSIFGRYPKKKGLLSKIVSNLPFSGAERGCSLEWKELGRDVFSP